MIRRGTTGAAACIAAGAMVVALAGGALAQEFGYFSPTTDTELQSTARIFPGMATFPGGGGVVLFGGAQPGGGTVYGDTWAWDGTEWIPICGTTATAACPGDLGPRILTNMGSDGGGVLLYGGLPSEASISNPVDAYDDLWRFDGSSWTQLCGGAMTACGPGARWSAASAGNGSVAVLFGGGHDSTSPPTLADTWVWDGSTWNQICGGMAQPACGPGARAGAGLAWDGAAFILFGGADQLGPGQTLYTDTWRLAPGDTTWTQVCDACAPPGRFWFGMTGLTAGDRPGAVFATGFQGSPPAAVADAWFIDQGGSDWEELPFETAECEFPSGLGLATFGGSTMVGLGLHFPGPGGNGTLLGAWNRPDSWTNACDAINNPDVSPSTAAPPTTAAPAPSTTPEGTEGAGSGDASEATLPRTGVLALPLTLFGVALIAGGEALRRRARRS